MNPLGPAARQRMDVRQRVNFMTTYSIREFKARASQILRDLAEGDEVIITRRGQPCGRRGQPCGKLTAVPQPAAAEKPARRSLRGIYRGILPHATYEDFQEIKKIWEPR